ncbi:drug resistance MFS transporter drug:H+ antiporter 2, partial [Alcaligenes faecalis subsp. faecalis NCIB 8687]
SDISSPSRCTSESSAGNQDKVRLDWLGAMLLMIGLACIQLLVELLPLYGGSYLMVLLGLCSLVAFSLLVAWERRVASCVG